MLVLILVIAGYIFPQCEEKYDGIAVLSKAFHYLIQLSYHRTGALFIA